VEVACWAADGGAGGWVRGVRIFCLPSLTYGPGATCRRAYRYGRGSAPRSEVVPGGGSHGEEEDMAGGVVVHEVVA
jgi:hypothetical protein